MSLLVHDCVGAVLVRDGQLLLGRRAAGRDWLADAWDVFGGHIESGEPAEQALVRELREELGIVPTRLRFLETLEGGDASERWRLRLYAVTALSGEPHNLQPREHDEMRWCSLADAEGKLEAVHPEFPRLLRLAAEID